MTASSTPNTNNSLNKKKKTIKPFDLWMEPILQESVISVTNVHKSILPQIPPWIIKKTPQNKNTSQHLSGKMSHYPLTPS